MLGFNFDSAKFESDVAHIKRVNAAEADYWAASAGTRIDDSSNILGFGDCGGQTDRQQ